MSLVGKVKVDIGDLVLFKAEEGIHTKQPIKKVGFVYKYNPKKVTLCSGNTREDNGEIRKMGFWGDTEPGEKLYDVFLEFYDNYKILKKWEEDKNSSLKAVEI